MQRTNDKFPRTKEDPHHPVCTNGYDEYPIDPAILQQAENYTFSDPLAQTILRSLRHPGRPTTNVSARPVSLA
jgi:hypothetical protein